MFFHDYNNLKSVLIISTDKITKKKYSKTFDYKKKLIKST